MYKPLCVLISLVAFLNLAVTSAYASSVDAGIAALEKSFKNLSRNTKNLCKKLAHQTKQIELEQQRYGSFESSEGSNQKRRLAKRFRKSGKPFLRPTAKTATVSNANETINAMVIEKNITPLIELLSEYAAILKLVSANKINRYQRGIRIALLFERFKHQYNKLERVYPVGDRGPALAPALKVLKALKVFEKIAARSRKRRKLKRIGDFLAKTKDEFVESLKLLEGKLLQLHSDLLLMLEKRETFWGKVLDLRKLPGPVPPYGKLFEDINELTTKSTDRIPHYEFVFAQEGNAVKKQYYKKYIASIQRDVQHLVTTMSSMNFIYISVEQSWYPKIRDLLSNLLKELNSLHGMNIGNGDPGVLLQQLKFVLGSYRDDARKLARDFSTNRFSGKSDAVGLAQDQYSKILLRKEAASDSLKVTTKDIKMAMQKTLESVTKGLKEKDILSLLMEFIGDVQTVKAGKEAIDEL